MQTTMYEGIVTRICIACAVNIVQIVIALTLYISIFLVFNQKVRFVNFAMNQYMVHVLSVQAPCTCSKKAVYLQ